jgi:outer membrane protein assembly factor BamA
VRAKLRITEGRKFDFYKWQQDRDRLQELFIERGYYEAHITARRDPSTPPPKPTSSTPVDLGYTIDAGGRTALESPASPSRNRFAKALVQAWATRRSTRWSSTSSTGCSSRGSRRTGTCRRPSRRRSA